MGWSGQSGAARYFFGTIIDKLLVNCPQTIMALNLTTKIVKFRKICVLMPRNADHELGFHAWMQLLLTLHRNTSGELLFLADKDTLKGVMRIRETMSLPEKNFRVLSHEPIMKTLAGELNENDLLVVISARPNAVSHNRQLALMPRVVSRYFSHTNSMILYPEQMDIHPNNLGVTFGGV